MQIEPDSERSLIETVINECLRRQWSEISQRAVRKVAFRTVWNRRLVEANRFLAAAVVLMSLQFAWATLTLYRLVH